MKRNSKRILFIAGGIIILFIAGLVFYRLPIFMMNPAKTGQVYDTNVYAVKNVINSVYFIKTGSDYILFDTGSDSGKLALSLREAKVDPNNVKWIFLTHSDYDHVAGLPLFANAKIYMSEDEFPMINGTVKRTIFAGNKIPSAVNIDSIVLLHDNQELLCDDTKIVCKKAPGHTIGSMVYLADNQYLFTGDAFKISSRKIGVHPYSMDSNLCKKTIERLRETIDGASIVFTAHYGFLNTASIIWQ